MRKLLVKTIKSIAIEMTQQFYIYLSHDRFIFSVESYISPSAVRSVWTKARRGFGVRPRRITTEARCIEIRLNG